MDDIQKDELQSDIHKVFEGLKNVTLNTTVDRGREPETVIFQPFNDYAYTPELTPEIKATPTLLESVVHEAKSFNTFGQIYEAFDKGEALKKDEEDEIPIGWKSSDNRDMYKNVPRKYWDTLYLATSPADQQRRYNYALDKAAEDEYYSQNSFMQNIVSKSLGFVGGVLTDPVTYIPFANALKYYRVGKTVVATAGKVAPTFAAIATGKDALRYGLDPDLTLQEAGYDAIVETLAGTLLVSGAAGLGRGWEGYKLFNLRKTQNLNFEGVGVKFKVGKDGELKGYQVESVGDTSMSAAERDIAQQYYDDAFKKGGLFWLPGVQKLTSFVSSPMRGLTSTFGPLRTLTNRLKNHDILTEGGNKGVPDNMSFESRMMFAEGDAAMFGAHMEGLRKQYNGVDLSIDEQSALKNINSNLNKKDPLDPASFGNRVSYAIINDTIPDNLQVNEAKKMWNEFAEKYWKKWQKAYGYDDETLPLSTAKGYLTQVYNRSQIAANESSWDNAVVAALKKQDKQINTLKAPIDELNSKIKLVKKDILDGVELEKNRAYLASLRKEKVTARDELVDTLRNTPELGLLLRERNLLKSEDAKSMKALFKPLEKIKKDYKKVQSDKEALNKQKFTLTNRLEAKTPKPKEGQKTKTEKQILNEHAKIKKELEKTEGEIEKLDAESFKLKNNILNEEMRLRDLALSGKISSKFFRKDRETGHIHFRDYKKGPKFRPLYGDESEMLEDAQALRVSIVNRSDDEVMTSRMENFAQIARENPTMARHVMLPSEVFLNNGFLVTDIPSIAYNYATGVGKMAAFEDSMKGIGDGFGELGFFDAMKSDYERQIRAIKANISEGPARDKKLLKLQKQYKKDIEFSKNFIDAMLGRAKDNRNIRRVAADMRNLAASTRLGFVPLTQIQDMMGNVFKHGLHRYIRDGFAPTLSTLNGLIKGNAGKRYRRYASEANLALEHLRGNFTKKFYAHDTFNDLNANPISKGLEKVAHFSNISSGSAFMENMNQRTTASIAQSKIIEYLQKFQKGTLKKNQMAELERAGIDPNKWTKPFLDQFELHGEKGIFGGRQSYYYNWGNQAAKVKMSEAIFNMTSNTIIKAGRAEMPLILYNPVLSLVTQFMGWSFAAFNRFGIPLMQRGEANQIFGTVLMAMMASMEGVTRKLARGEEVDMNDENFIAEAFANSAPTAMLYKSVMYANQFLDVDFLNKMKNDKYRNITMLGLVQGPAFGVVEDWSKFGAMVASQDFNKQEFAKGVRAVPGIQAWYGYQLQQKFIDAVTEELPEHPQRKEKAQ